MSSDRRRKPAMCTFGCRLALSAEPEWRGRLCTVLEPGRGPEQEVSALVNNVSTDNVLLMARTREWPGRAGLLLLRELMLSHYVRLVTANPHGLRRLHEDPMAEHLRISLVVGPGQLSADGGLLRCLRPQDTLRVEFCSADDLMPLREVLAALKPRCGVCLCPTGGAQDREALLRSFMGWQRGSGMDLSRVRMVV